MKKRLLQGLTALLLCTNILFCGLWLLEKESVDELELLCRYSANRAKDRFESFQLQESAYDYAYAVAELTGYYNAYTMLTTQSQGATNTNVLWLNQLLGELMKYPPITPAQNETLIEALEILGADSSSETAYQMLFELYNELSR